MNTTKQIISHYLLSREVKSERNMIFSCDDSSLRFISKICSVLQSTRPWEQRGIKCIYDPVCVYHPRLQPPQTEGKPVRERIEEVRRPDIRGVCSSRWTGDWGQGEAGEEAEEGTVLGGGPRGGQREEGVPGKVGFSGCG